MQAYCFDYDERGLDVNNIIHTLHVTIDGNDVPVNVSKVKVTSKHTIEFVDLYGSKWLLVGETDELEHLFKLIMKIREETI